MRNEIEEERELGHQFLAMCQFDYYTCVNVYALISTMASVRLIRMNE